MSEPVIEKSRVSKIHIGRVFNLGNYENIRYEISVDVGTNDNPAEVLTWLEKILNNLYAKSSIDAYELRRAREAVAKNPEELDVWDKNNLESYKAKIADHDAAMERRKKARQLLNTLNASSEFTDHKLDWEDGDDYEF